MSESKEPYQSSEEGMALFTMEVEEGSSEEVIFTSDFSDNFNSYSELSVMNNEKSWYRQY